MRGKDILVNNRKLAAKSLISNELAITQTVYSLYHVPDSLNVIEQIPDDNLDSKISL